MTEKLKQTIKEELEKLPKHTQEVIASYDWIKTTEELGKKYLLTESEVNDFQTETLLVLIGVADPDLYINNIENKVGISKNDAEKMANEVLEKVFTPIVNVLEKSVKKNIQDKKTNLIQNVNFILSGGDYSVFIDNTNIKSIDNTQKVNSVLGTKSMQDIKDRLVN